MGESWGAGKWVLVELTGFFRDSGLGSCGEVLMVWSMALCSTRGFADKVPYGESYED